MPPKSGGLSQHDAGWSSLVARQAHNLKVAGSNPAPATILSSLSLPLIDISHEKLIPVPGVARTPQNCPGTDSFERASSSYRFATLKLDGQLICHLATAMSPFHTSSPWKTGWHANARNTWIALGH